MFNSNCISKVKVVVNFVFSVCFLKARKKQAFNLESNDCICAFTVNTGI